ncbi:MAG: GxxExxY protein [Chthoniobacteraceae bacterium]
MTPFFNAEAQRGNESYAEEIMRENEITQAVIGATIEVHKILGPGLIERPYEDAMCREFHLRGLKWERQMPVAIEYKGVKLGTPLVLDLLLEEKVIIDLKAKETVTGLDKKKVLTYLRLSNLRLGLIINFNVELLRDGITRIVNDFEDREDNDGRDKDEGDPQEPPNLHE